MVRKGLLLFICACPLLEIEAQEIKQPSDSVKRLEEVVVFSRQLLGSKFRAANRTGSAYYLAPKEIQKLGYTDINRMLRGVPGVNIYEEDGFGLRPNISLRGTKAERSERISLMEDGILAAPAPYAAPAAYYFPNAARMHAVEVLKGSSQVQYGPFTTGGAINMVSTPIPNKKLGKLSLTYGSYKSLKGHLQLGNSYKYWGYLVEYLRYSSEGFRPNKQSAKPGFVRNDLIAKVSLHTAPEQAIYQSLEFKFGFANEDSDESYVGLTAQDFNQNPYARYTGASADRMTNKHTQWTLTHQLNIPKTIRVTTSAYLSKFHRNWYKLNDVVSGITKAEKRSIANILADPKTNHRHYALITGQRDYLGEALIVRANNRGYISQGLQTKLEHKRALAQGYLDLELGLRLHHDQEDRFQWEDSYAIEQGAMKLFRKGEKGSQANRLTWANAFASYILGKLSLKALTLTAGLRYEDVSLNKKDYTTADLRRSGHLRIQEQNHIRSLIPSLGISYRLTSEVSLFGGIHKGFAPPAAERGQKAESSINTELGVRFSSRKLRAEMIGFYNDYRNMLGSDLAASGGQGTLDQFDVGKARVHGLEVLLHYQPLPKAWRIQLPIQLSYTYTDTKMRNSFVSSSWGQVWAGDELPYIFKHALNLQLGVEHRFFDLNIGLRYNGAMRTTPGQGVIATRERIPAHTLLDASLRLHLHRQVSLQLSGINLLNKRYLASRHPSGLRAGHPRGLYVGITAHI